MNAEEARFGHTNEQFDRGTLFFKNAQKRNQDYEATDYLLNHEIRKIEDPNKDVEPLDYQKALFYIYGHCKDFQGSEENKGHVLAHGLLKSQNFFKSNEEAKAVL